MLRTRLKLYTNPSYHLHTHRRTHIHQSEKAGSAHTETYHNLLFTGLHRLDRTQRRDTRGKRTVLQASITFAELLAHYLDVKRAERPAEIWQRHGRNRPGTRCDRSGSRTKKIQKNKKRGDRADCNVNFSLLSPDMSDRDDGGRPSTELSNHLTLPCWQWSQT